MGDATAEDAYRRTSSAVMSYESEDIVHARLHAFDIWNDPFSPFDERYGSLLGRMSNLPSWVEIVPNALLHDMEMLNEYEQRRLSEGHEGVILRRRDALYKEGRGTPTKGQLIKLKRFDDAEGRIVGVHELFHNGNEATINALGYTEHSGHKENLVPMDTLGAVEVSLDMNPDFAKSASQSVRIGTGFTAQMREDLWKDRDNLLGKIVKYKYFKIGVKDAPRFPVFLGLRDADDISPTGQGSLL